MKKVFIGSDHAGYRLKERIKKELGQGFEFLDLGTDSDEPVDYPKYGEKLAQKVVATPKGQGILVCGSGVGISIAANKVPGARCVLAFSKEVAQGSREHNDANIVAVAGRMKMLDDPVEIVRTFLETDFSNEERHQRRVKQMMDIEKNNS